MSLTIINPLDQVPSPAVPSVIIHTSSYSDDIKNGNIEFEKLLKIASLKTCNLVFTPVDDSEVRIILDSYGLDIASYYLQENQYIIKSRFIEAAFSNEIDPQLFKHFKEEKGEYLNDYMTLGSRWFHYSVSKTHPQSVSVTIILDILQVFHIKNKIFIGFDFGDMGEFLYNMHKINMQIPNHRMLWIEFNILKSVFSSDGKTIENLLQSLYDRVSLMNKALVELKYHSLKTVTKDASMDIMYHLSFLVILITGSYDNIAWILNYIFGLGFSLNNDTRNKVKLHKSNTINNSKSKPKSDHFFYKELLVKSPDIAKYLLSRDISGLIDFIYPLRDSIQHRSFIKPVFSRTNQKVSNLFICFPSELTKELQLNFDLDKFGYNRDISRMMNGDYYDVYIFSNKVHEMVIELIDTVSGMISLKKTVPLTPEKIQLIDDAKSKYLSDPLAGSKLRQSIIY